MQQTIRCPECGQEFPTQQAMQEHVNREHMGTMTESGNASQAENNAGGISQQQCPGCGSEYPSDESMAEHRREQHAGEPTSSV